MGKECKKLITHRRLKFPELFLHYSKYILNR